MRFVIIGKIDEPSQAGKRKITDAFNAAGFIYDEKNPELIISIGGDGILLEAFRLYDQQLNDVKFVGIHSGHLGFYTDWLLSEVDEFIDAVLTTEPVDESYPLLAAKVIFEKNEKRYLALNEVRVADYCKTLALNVYIDGRLFETFRGTGLSVCTPSGSTGYNKALGGSIVHPSMQTFQLTEIASVNNTVFRTVGSSMVLGKNENIRLELSEFAESFIFIADLLSSEFTHSELVKAFDISIATERITFARYREVDFWQRVCRSFIQSSNEILG